MTECNVTCDDCGQDSIPKVWHCLARVRMGIAHPGTPKPNNERGNAPC